MLITIDLDNPDNDVELLGLADGETAETRLGKQGYAAYRVFGAAARLLFLSLQDVSNRDIAAATEMMLERESAFIRQQLSELGRGGAPSKPGQGQRGNRDRGRR